MLYEEGLSFSVDKTDTKAFRPFLVKLLTRPSFGLVSCSLIKRKISCIGLDFFGCFGLLPSLILIMLII